MFAPRAGPAPGAGADPAARGARHPNAAVSSAAHFRRARCPARRTDRGHRHAGVQPPRSAVPDDL